MARQVRSEATRRRILDAAIDVFGQIGYAAAGRTAITERANLTKGALYHHFDSMDALASAVIDEGFETVLDAFHNVCQSPSPALENMIHGTFIAADLFTSDRVVNMAGHLAFALAGYNQKVVHVYAKWSQAMTVQAEKARSEGDLRETLDPNVVSESIVGAVAGADLLSRTAPDRDLVARLDRAWGLLLPAIVADSALPYFREFLAREQLRHLQPSSS